MMACLRDRFFFLNDPKPCCHEMRCWEGRVFFLLLLNAFLKEIPMPGKRGGFVVGVVVLRRRPTLSSMLLSCPRKAQDALQTRPPRPGTRPLRCSLKKENKSENKVVNAKIPCVVWSRARIRDAG